MRIDARRFLTETPNGDAVCVDVRLILTPEEESALMEGYDPNSDTSPDVSVCRPIVRQILDVLKVTT